MRSKKLAFSKKLESNVENVELRSGYGDMHAHRDAQMMAEAIVMLRDHGIIDEEVATELRKPFGDRKEPVAYTRLHSEYTGIQPKMTMLATALRRQKKRDKEMLDLVEAYEAGKIDEYANPIAAVLTEKAEDADTEMTNDTSDESSLTTIMSETPDSPAGETAAKPSPIKSPARSRKRTKTLSDPSPIKPADTELTDDPSDGSDLTSIKSKTLDALAAETALKSSPIKSPSRLRKRTKTAAFPKPAETSSTTSHQASEASEDLEERKPKRRRTRKHSSSEDFEEFQAKPRRVRKPVRNIVPLQPLPGGEDYAQYNYYELLAICRQRKLLCRGIVQEIRNTLVRDDINMAQGIPRFVPKWKGWRGRAKHLHGLPDAYQGGAGVVTATATAAPAAGSEAEVEADDEAEGQVKREEFS